VINFFNWLLSLRLVKITSMRKALFVRMFLVVWISSAFPLRARDVSARLWDAETGRLLRTFKGFHRPCLEVVFFPDGQQILAGSLTPELRIWNVATGKPASLFPRSSDGACRALAISPDGQKMLAASSLGNADIYDPKTGDLIQRLLNGQSGLKNAGFSLNDKLVFFVFDARPSFAIYDSDAGWALNSFREQTLSHSRYLTLTMNGKAQSWWDPLTGARIRDESKIGRQDFRETDSAASFRSRPEQAPGLVLGRRRNETRRTSLGHSFRQSALDNQFHG
jgi:WD40 repeat protein